MHICLCLHHVYQDQIKYDYLIEQIFDTGDPAAHYLFVLLLERLMTSHCVGFDFYED